MTDISPLVAFLAGLLSFLSPCVLPLVPGYVSLMCGVSVEQLREGRAGGTRAVFVHALLFVLGLSAVFVAMGTSASAVGQFLRAHLPVLVRFAGVFIILLGVFLLGLFRIPALYRVARFQGRLRPGKLGAFLLGLSFAFCWTPCIGPILAAILLLAATKGTIAQGVFLLSLYSLGLGVPFLLTAVGINTFLNFYQGLRRYLNWVERAAGVLLIAVGVLLVANQFNWLASQFGFLKVQPGRVTGCQSSGPTGRRYSSAGSSNGGSSGVHFARYFGPRCFFGVFPGKGAVAGLLGDVVRALREGDAGVSEAARPLQGPGASGGRHRDGHRPR